MAKRNRRTITGVVSHPRYGSAVVRSGTTATPEEVRASYWQYKEADIFPESAIAADISKQNFTTFPRAYYVDMRKTCRDCKREFIFFAREQQHWYEELGFYIDADCERCFPCRKSERTIPRHFRRYSELIAKKTLTDDELVTVVRDAIALWNAGVLRDEQRLRRFRNLARRRIPGESVTKKLDDVIAKIAPKR